MSLKTSTLEVSPVSAAKFFADALQRIPAVIDMNSDSIIAAASLLAPVITSGGLIHAFGSGHSQAGAMELAGRAGGLIPTNRLSLGDLVLRGTSPASLLDDPLLERRADVGRELLEISDIRGGDALVVFSNSGINGSVVELTLAAQQQGIPIVAVTSRAHSTAAVSRHASGKKLFELADVVLDNGAPEGDAILDLPTGGKVAAVSSITTAVLIQGLVSEIVSRLLAAGIVPPVYVSANLPGGHEANLAIEATYNGRLRRLAG